MPAFNLPALNMNVCSGWTEQQRELYNYLPFHLAEMQVNRRKWYATWAPFLGSMRWQPNMGEILKAVRKEPSPVLRQHAFPTNLSEAATKDLMDVREVTTTARVKHKKFESPIFQFYPSFRDFMKNHVEVHAKDIMEKMEIYEDFFYRSAIWHYAPFVFLPDAAGGPLLDAPSAEGNEANDAPNSKTTAWLLANIINIGNPGNLSLTAVNLATTIMANDLGVPPYSGSNNAKNTSSSGLQEKFVLVTSSEAYNQFFFDPWMLSHKNCQLDVITAPFRGDLFGQVTCRLERYPIRIAVDGTFPAPETRVVGTNNINTASENDPYNVGETIPNPTYVNAPYEVAFLVGDKGYDAITVGPPPKAFANGMPDGFGKMQWNGEVFLTKNLLVHCGYDENGHPIYEPNSYGEYVKYQAHAVYGIIGRQRRNIIPIIFKRRRGPSA